MRKTRAAVWCQIPGATRPEVADHRGRARPSMIASAGVRSFHAPLARFVILGVMTLIDLRPGAELEATRRRAGRRSGGKGYPYPQSETPVTHR